MGFEFIKKIAELIKTLDEKVKEEDYKKEVLNQLDEIESQIRSFYKAFKQFEDAQGFSNLLESLENPITTTNGWYDGDAVGDSVIGWLNGKYGPPASETESDIKEHARTFLTNIFQAITNKDTLKIGQKLWMTYFYDWITDTRNSFTWGLPHISPSESLYLYWCYTCALQGKIYTAAVWANYTSVINDYKTGLPDNLKKQGQAVQAQVNDWKTEAAWPDHSWTQVKFNSFPTVRDEIVMVSLSDTILLGGWPALPADRANPVYPIYDFGFVRTSDAPDAPITLKVRYGNLNSLGYIEPVGEAIVQDGQKTPVGYGSSYSSSVIPFASGGSFIADVGADEVVIGMRLVDQGGLSTSGNHSVGLEVLVGVPIIKEDGTVGWQIFPNSGNPYNLVKYGYQTSTSDMGQYVQGFDNSFKLNLIGTRPIDPKANLSFPPLNRAYTQISNGNELINRGTQEFHLNSFGQ